MRMQGKNAATIETQAAAWLARRDGGMSGEERMEFDRWCAADPRHAAAIAEIGAVWAALDRPAESGQAESFRTELRALARRDRRRRVAWGSATVLAAACITVILFWSNPPDRAPTPLAVVSSTARVTEPERKILPDGSIVELKPGADIVVAFTAEARAVVLKGGEAHFSVTKDPLKPFTVTAGTVKIRAVGTAFGVQLGRTEVEVLVTEGKVSVTAPVSSGAPISNSREDDAAEPVDGAMQPMVEVGQRAIVSLRSNGPSTEVVSIPPAELAERLSWRLPLLDFSETSLDEAIALFNRHGAMQLRVADPAVAALRITGIFRSDNASGFVRVLESGLGVRAETQNGEIVLHSAR